MIETLTVVAEQIPLDLLMWCRKRCEVPGLVEATLRRNTGLARIDVFLPVGMAFDVQTLDPEP